MYRNQSGQIGLVVLLIMTTMITVGIGAITRSTSDLKITGQELESSILFNAAEAGVEAALGEIDSGSPSLSPVNIQVDSIPVTYTISEVHNFDMVVEENSYVFVDVSRATPQSTDKLAFQWAQDYGTTPNCTTADLPPSLEVVIYRTTPLPALINAYYRCDRGDGLIDGTSGNLSINLDPDDLMVGFRSLYGGTQVTATAEGGWTMPLQGYQVRSQASSVDTDESKVIVVDRSAQMPASVLGFTVFSGTTLLMN